MKYYDPLSMLGTARVSDFLYRLESSDLFERACVYAGRCHRIVNHRYDDMPYEESHLKSTVEYGKKYARVLVDAFPEEPYEAIELALSACWPHDTIEDARQTFSDVKTACGIKIAEIVYALTNEKGRTRKHRANAKYYRGIRCTHLAAFVKACDRLANISHSHRKGGSMLNVYMKEHQAFVKNLKPTWFERLVNWYQWVTLRESMFDGMELYEAMKPMFDEMEQMTTVKKIVST